MTASSGFSSSGGRTMWSAFVRLHACAPHGCFIVLERMRSPGNLGSLIRSASAFGGTGFILIGPEIDPFEPATVRATMGERMAWPR